MTARNIAAVIVIVAVCHLAYWNALSGPFQFDDNYQVNNRDIRNVLDPETIWNVSRLRVVLVYTFAINFAIGGMNPWNYHYTNLLIHAGNAILIFFLGGMILRRLLGGGAEGEADDSAERAPVNLAAFLAALFFTVHPLMTEGVTYISGRSSSLCALFGLLAILLYLRGRTAARERSAAMYIVFAFLFCVLAMFTKESGAVIPLIIVLVEYFCFLRRRTNSLPAALGTRGLLCISPFTAMLALAAGYVAYRLWKYGVLSSGGEGNLSIPYLLTQFKVWPRYIGAMFFPIWLNIDHRVPLANGLSADILISMVLILALMAAAIIRMHGKGHRGLVSFAVFWMAASLIPTSSIFYLRDAMAERHMYFPSIGLFLLGGYVIAMALNIARSLWAKRRLAPYLPVLALLGVFGFMTYERNTLYSDHLKLWLNVRNQEPSSYRATYSCGLGWLEHAILRALQGRTDLRTALLWNARNSLIEANRFGPDEHDPYFALSDMETAQQDFQSAVGYATQATCLAEKGKGATVDDYSHLIRVYFFAGVDGFNKSQALKDKADKLKEQGGREEDVDALLQKSESEYENARRNLQRSTDIYEQTLVPLPSEYQKEDEFVAATRRYYEAHRLLGYYYRDHNDARGLYYFQRWAGYISPRATEAQRQEILDFITEWQRMVGRAPKRNP